MDGEPWEEGEEEEDQTDDEVVPEPADPVSEKAMHIQ